MSKKEDEKKVDFTDLPKEKRSHEIISRILDKYELFKGMSVPTYEVNKDGTKSKIKDKTIQGIDRGKRSHQLRIYFDDGTDVVYTPGQNTKYVGIMGPKLAINQIALGNNSHGNKGTQLEYVYYRADTDEKAKIDYTDKDGKKKVAELPITPSADGLSTSGTVETDEGATKTLSITANSMEKLRGGIIAGLEEIENKYGKIVTIYKKKEELDKDESALIIRDNKVPEELTDLLDESIDIDKIADVDELNNDIQHILKTESDDDERAEKIREAVQKQRRNIKTKDIKLNLQKRKSELNALLNKFEKYKKEGGAYIDPKTGRVVSVANNKNRKKNEPVMVGSTNPKAT